MKLNPLSAKSIGKYLYFFTILKVLDNFIAFNHSGRQVNHLINNFSSILLYFLFF